MTLTTLLSTLALLILFFTFVISATAKLTNLNSFEKAIRGFRIVPYRWVHIVARCVVLLEVLAAILLLLAPRLGALLASVLLVTFTLTLARALRLRLAVTCNCFGGSGTAPVSRIQIYRNLLLMIAGALALIEGMGKTWTSVDVTANVGLVLSLAGVALVIAVALSQIETIVMLFRAETDHAAPS